MTTYLFVETLPEQHPSPNPSGHADTERWATLVFEISVKPEPAELPSPRVRHQREYLVEGIQRMLDSPEYKRGTLAAVYSGNREGKDIGIGNPPSLSLLERSFAELTMGKCSPVYGLTSVETLDQLFKQTRLDLTLQSPNALRFRGAEIHPDPSVPDGCIRWYYGHLGIPEAVLPWEKIGRLQKENDSDD
jgi:hypothetical protein